MQKVFAARAKRHHANPAGGANRRTSLRKTARRRIFPDISWDWLESELNTIATRAQDPYYISEADKQVIRNELFPFWKGKSSSEACDAELKKAGLWDYGVGAAITDLTYHMTSGGDTSPGFDIILLKKGVLAILAEAEEHLQELDPQAEDYPIRKALSVRESSPIPAGWPLMPHRWQLQKATRAERQNYSKSPK